jgi:hypothetical protein
MGLYRLRDEMTHSQYMSTAVTERAGLRVILSDCLVDMVKEEAAMRERDLT